MVEIRFPPPTRNISPKFKILQPGTVIRRIFDPASYQAQRIRADRRKTTGDADASRATGFRYFGPLSRFDHQQRQKRKPILSSDRGIIYAGFSLSCCLIEIFGDEGTIYIKQQQIANVILSQDLKLLDLRDSGAWDAGSVASMPSDGMRKLTQSWSNYFYENPQLYGHIDGLIFNNAHNGEEAIALYERAKAQLESANISIINLNDPVLIESIYAIAQKLNLLVEVDKL